MNDIMNRHFALLESNIVYFNKDILSYYSPTPIYINIASCLYMNTLYILCKNNEQYLLRKIILTNNDSSNTLFETIDMILLPDDDIYHNIWMDENKNLFIISKKYIIEIVFDESKQVIIQMKKYELFSDSNLLIDSFTYQDGYYYILAYQLNETDINNSYTNYIFIFNKDFEYKQVYSLPYNEKCSQLRYYGIYLLFVKGSEIIKYNFITNESEIFISLSINAYIKSYYISENNEIICLLQNPNTYISCDICKITIHNMQQKQCSYMYFEKIIPIIKQIIDINYSHNVLLPSLIWKTSYVKHINIQNDTKVEILCKYLIDFYKERNNYTKYIYDKIYKTKNITYSSLEDFLSISDNYLSDIKDILPSYANLQPKQFKYDEIEKNIHNKDDIIFKLNEYITSNDIRMSGWFFYDKGHNLGWHTNLDIDSNIIHNQRKYIVINDSVFGSSYFMYKHPISQQIHIIPDDKISSLQFSFGTKEQPFWHAVYCKEGTRMSFGQIV